MKSKKALYNIVTEFLYQIVAIVCSFILPRFILKSYGSEYNGLTQSITQFLSYISLLTLGISGSTRVAIYKSKGDTEKISSVIKTTQNYMKKVSCAFIAYVLILTFVYPLIIKTSVPRIEIVLLVIIIGIGTFFEYALGVTYSALVSAMQSKYIHNIILICLKIISTLVSTLLILNGNNIFIVKLIGSICFALGPIILTKVVNKKYNINVKAKPDNNTLNQKKDVMAHSIANCVHEYTDVFLLSLFSNATVISIYSVYNLVLGGIRKIPTIFTNGLEGAFGEIWAKDDKIKFKESFNTFEFLMYSLASVLFTCTAFLMIPFIKIYTKGVTDINYILPTFAYLSVLATATLCIRTPYVIAVQAAGMYKETKKAAITEAALNFVISLIFVFKFGIIGVTIGTLIANIYRTIQYETFISNKLIDRSNKDFIKILVWSGTCFTISLVLKTIIPIPIINTWIDWILHGILYLIITLAVSIFMAFLFYKSELEKSLTIVRKMFKKRGNS